MATTQQPQQQPPKPTTTAQVHLPRVTIKYCTQCKWMLRAAYFAQELLSTFNTDLAEVALIPVSGGVFTVTMYSSSSSSSSSTTSSSGESGNETVEAKETVLWDRKVDGGFPEVKHLKSLVRNIIDPSRDLGHTDRALRAANSSAQGHGHGHGHDQGSQDQGDEKKKECEECQ